MCMCVCSFQAARPQDLQSLNLAWRTRFQGTNCPNYEWFGQVWMLQLAWALQLAQALHWAGALQRAGLCRRLRICSRCSKCSRQSQVPLVVNTSEMTIDWTIWWKLSDYNSNTLAQLSANRPRTKIIPSKQHHSVFILPVERFQLRHQKQSRASLRNFIRNTICRCYKL